MAKKKYFEAMYYVEAIFDIYIHKSCYFVHNATK
jgi:hypothetical protein